MRVELDRDCTREWHLCPRGIVPRQHRHLNEQRRRAQQGEWLLTAGVECSKFAVLFEHLERFLHDA